MIQSLKLNKSSYFYYDEENRIIARKPSNSNLKKHGSDNSLYFGTIYNEKSVEIFCKIFNVKSIESISGKSFDFYAFNNYFNVIVNINKEGQIQIKIPKDGSMYKIANLYMFDIMENIDCTKKLIVLDFKNNEIRFIDDLKL